VLDMEEMAKLDEVIRYENPEDVNESIDKVFGGVDSIDAPCSTNNLVIQNNVVSIKVSELGGDNDYNPGF